MKLSSLSSDELADALCLLAPPLSRLAEDPAVGESLSGFRRAQEDGLPLITAAGKLIGGLIPALLKSRREDTLAVLAVLTGKPVPELRAQPGLTTVADAVRCWDEDLALFFSCAGGGARQDC